MQRKAITRWLVLCGLVIAGFFATVTTLNLTLYSASGFVHSYLDALARHDVEGALAMPGVALSGGGSTVLVSHDALGNLGGIRLVSDTDNGAGSHTVVYQYSFGAHSGTTTFHVEHAGSRLGFFAAWRFIDSPDAHVSLTPDHATTFEANGVGLTSSKGPGAATDYHVLVPALVELSHSSAYLTADKTSVLASKVGSRMAVAVDIQANSAFRAEVSKELDRFLAACVTQKVLLPTGCPMGKAITDRIQNDPTWSMVVYPVVKIEPVGETGSWQIPDTPAMAHLVVKVRSIFDGSISTFDQDIPFSVGYLINFGADGAPTITAQY
jgi:hypothetical protein